MSCELDILEELTFLEQLEKLTEEVRLLRETIAEANGLWTVQSFNSLEEAREE